MQHVRSTIVGCAALALVASAGRAQVVALPPAPIEPTYWVSGGFGFYDLGTFAGGRDGAFWDFDDSFQARASVERRIKRYITVGLAATISRFDVRITDGGCGDCDSDVNMYQGLALARYAGGDGQGFYNAIEVTGGVAHFDHFSDAGAADPTEPLRSYVPSFAASYALGYSFWRGLDLALTQELGFLYYRPVEGSSSTSTPRFTSTRLELRYSWR